MLFQLRTQWSPHPLQGWTADFIPQIVEKFLAGPEFKDKVIAARACMRVCMRRERERERERERKLTHYVAYSVPGDSCEWPRRIPRCTTLPPLLFHTLTLCVSFPQALFNWHGLRAFSLVPILLRVLSSLSHVVIRPCCNPTGITGGATFHGCRLLVYTHPRTRTPIHTHLHSSKTKGAAVGAAAAAASRQAEHLCVAAGHWREVTSATHPHTVLVVACRSQYGCACAKVSVHAVV